MSKKLEEMEDRARSGSPRLINGADLLKLVAVVRAAKRLHDDISDDDAYDELGGALLSLEADAKALRDMRTLDDWAARHACREVYLDHAGFEGDRKWFLNLDDDRGENHDFHGATPDEARGAAAAWVRAHGREPLSYDNATEQERAEIIDATTSR